MFKCEGSVVKPCGETVQARYTDTTPCQYQNVVFGVLESGNMMDCVWFLLHASSNKLIIDHQIS